MFKLRLSEDYSLLHLRAQRHQNPRLTGLSSCKNKCLLIQLSLISMAINTKAHPIHLLPIPGVHWWLISTASSKSSYLPCQDCSPLFYFCSCCVKGFTDGIDAIFFDSPGMCSNTFFHKSRELLNFVNCFRAIPDKRKPLTCASTSL